MAVKILFLGPLQDLAGAGERMVDGPLDWNGLIEAVGLDVAAKLQSEKVNVACSGRLLPDKSTLAAQDGDEIALLPPVSGG
ncbi:MoaD/ThiS family protein [Altererythrobacter sp. SALINAS58]|uniref:MoaD/ThiS family protein n=1 Tax=Alteripontixanthobacter muriae TaxID=2705546 RepID=UPI0015762F8E|nr:MoaD/ThiS family protein [Alteripontixanthobacter muriae]NTZ42497.1 MoaD/ThiS family protein [Alteripontixanthobacter muriae]